MQGFLPCSPGTVNTGAHNTVDASEAHGGALPYLSGMGVDGAHNTVGENVGAYNIACVLSCREVAWYCPAGVHGTVLGIAVDLSALPYFLRPFPGSLPSGSPWSVGSSWL